MSSFPKGAEVHYISPQAVVVVKKYFPMESLAGPHLGTFYAQTEAFPEAVQLTLGTPI